jgi:hypothetical protein
MQSRFKLLLLATINRTSISRKARDLREEQLVIPSGEVTLAWLKTNSVEDIRISQQIGFQQFLESLPESFQIVRNQGMLLAIDFHTDPNYARTTSNYIRGGKKKASTHQFYEFITVIWLNAPEPITLGVQLIPKDFSLFKTVQSILSPLITKEKVIGILADGGFYNYDLIQWFIRKQVFFVVRGRVNTGVKPLIQKHQNELQERGNSRIVDYKMNKGHTRKRFPVKLVLYREKERIIALIAPPNCNKSGTNIYKLYQHRFTIETYYRQMHRFQVFSCSRHPALRYIIVVLAFWLCNFWAYFKSPLKLLKRSSRRCRADFIYTANDFCEFLSTSWNWILFSKSTVFSRR